MQIRRFKY